ncbi:TnsD family Tn7-like transposition protein [Paenibacillus sediminis]|uniref:Transposase-like protein n=1 Tax=Paenibacillus sediminis TaxID=664909 RepID=A0ABS4H439_9BACL|nr:TnsD family Tn7-like transposition protein [Paenibacillus sediminis]MBP1937303.1 transposase-like protein [Paenibacillus sediminis]
MRIYPDEILVSIIARYKFQNHTSMKQMVRKVYDLKHKKTSLDLPTNIRSILDVLPSTDEEILLNNTLFPLYKSFLSSSQVIAIRDQMLNGPGGAVHSKAGLLASVVKLNDSLRLCPSCLVEDFHNHGEAYWHREHQLPGHLYCRIHKCRLLTQCWICNESLSSNCSKEISICPTFCKYGHDLTSQIIACNNEMTLKVTEGITDLFNAALGDRIPIDLRDKYLLRLTQMNLCTVKGRIKQQEVCSKFISLFSKDVLKDLGVRVPTGPNNWLATILRKPRHSFHPLLHVLVIEFLWGGISAISHNHLLPFGIGPWPCLNKIADHYKKDTIKTVMITRCSKTKKVVGSFKCDVCGFQYSRRGPNHSAEDTYSYGRIKDFGHYWKEKADELLKKGGSIRSISRVLKVDSATVNLYIKKKQLPTITETPMSINSRDFRRKRLIQTINNMPSNSSSTVRQMNAKDYMWLYRNDKQWLQTVLPKSPRRVKVRSRVNWNQRDKNTANAINEAIVQLRLSKDKPERLTLARIGNFIGKRALLERHLNRLPICQGLLKMNLETEEQYQIRRIDWAFERVRQQGKRPARWRIIREAGIRIFKSECVEKYLVHKINEACYLLRDAYTA